jgi:hypothetical protein
VGFWPVWLASIGMRGLGLVATQTLVFLFAGIGVPAAMVRRAGGGYCRLAGAGLAGYGR